MDPAVAEAARRAALPLAAQRALAEADARRAKAIKDGHGNETPKSTEVDGPSGKEPTRFGDWEKKGITSDF
ncbi:MAG: succinate dehydrogenase assembly factor 4 [Pseudomonadota bacterium]